MTYIGIYITYKYRQEILINDAKYKGVWESFVFSADSSTAQF